MTQALPALNKGTAGRALLRELVIAVAVLSVWWAAYYSLVDEPLVEFGNNGVIILIAFVAATVANATAVGGGFIFMPVFSMFYGIGSVEALKLALSTQAFGMSSGAMNWPRGQILWRHLALAMAGASIGMLAGSLHWMPDTGIINPVFGAASVLIGLALFIEYFLPGSTAGSPRPASAPGRGLFFLICAAGGFLTAWISIGIGEIVALWLLFVWRHTLLQSVATGVCALAFCSVLGLGIHLYLGGIPWQYLAFTVPGVILGGRAGARLGAYLAGGGHTSRSDTELKMLIALVIFVDGLVVLFH